MEKHPIECLMSSTLDSIRSMIDVNTVIGMPIETQDGVTVIPFSKVSFGLAVGGAQYEIKSKQGEVDKYPFAGGTGAGVSLQPVGFLVVKGTEVRILPATHNNPYEKLLEMIPNIVSDVKKIIDSKANTQCTCTTGE